MLEIKFHKGAKRLRGERGSERNDSGANGKVGETTQGRKGKWAKRLRGERESWRNDPDSSYLTLSQIILSYSTCITFFCVPNPWVETTYQIRPKQSKTVTFHAEITRPNRRRAETTYSHPKSYLIALTFSQIKPLS